MAFLLFVFTGSQTSCLTKGESSIASSTKRNRAVHAQDSLPVIQARIKSVMTLQSRINSRFNYWGQSLPIGQIICLPPRFEPYSQLFNLLRPRVVIWTDGKIGAPILVAVPKAPQVAVRVPLFALLSAKSGREGQPCVR